MHLIRGLHNLNLVQDRLEAGCVLTIGNFDGVHLGHQQVLASVFETAAHKKIPSVVMIFEPLPIEYFSAQVAPVRLMNLREKLQAFQSTDIDFVLLARFDDVFASRTAEEFVTDILLDGLNIKHLVVGDDFRFGKGREGNFTFLQARGERDGFTVNDIPTFRIEGERSSSTNVRAQLDKPNLEKAECLLGKPFCFNGRVIHGQKLGRKIGFRTLNLNPKREKMPVLGVFAVKVSGIADRDWEGVANIGVRPTVSGLRPSIEVHLFNWDADLYGKHVTVKLAKFIRPEMKFDGLDALVAQIKLDAAHAKEFFKI